MGNILFDYVVIGGGIFGSYAAKILGTNNTVALIEKESALLQRASKNNQTRVHTGAHYLRAPRTAMSAQSNLSRFLIDHNYAISKTSQHFYAIAREGSLTDSDGFERFCGWLGVKATKSEECDLFDPSRISNTYQIDEHSFDPVLLARQYLIELLEKNVSLYFDSHILSIEKLNEKWIIKVRLREEIVIIEAANIVNATYSNLNAISKLSGIPMSRIKHEYSELLLVFVPKLRDKAITVMDGPFFSITPYGATGLHVLSSVIYTHHASVMNSEFELSCQLMNTTCRVDTFNLCQTCDTKPKSLSKFMLNQLRTYVPDIGTIFVHGKIETIKSTWGSNDYRDERNTSIKKITSNPGFYNVLSGKVSSIYELEVVLNENG